MGHRLRTRHAAAPRGLGGDGRQKWRGDRLEHFHASGPAWYRRRRVRTGRGRHPGTRCDGPLH